MSEDLLAVEGVEAGARRAHAGSEAGAVVPEEPAE
jgi:hypothetical protein